MGRGPGSPPDKGSLVVPRLGKTPLGHHLIVSFPRAPRWSRAKWPHHGWRQPSLWCLLCQRGLTATLQVEPSPFYGLKNQRPDAQQENTELGIGPAVAGCRTRGWLPSHPGASVIHRVPGPCFWAGQVAGLLTHLPSPMVSGHLASPGHQPLP